jgi:hypothetical protein
VYVEANKPTFTSVYGSNFKDTDTFINDHVGLIDGWTSKGNVTSPLIFTMIVSTMIVFTVIVFTMIVFIQAPLVWT